MIDTYWSDHCRHTTFLTRLNNIEIEKGKLSGAIEKALGEYFAAREELYKGKDKPVSLMDMAVIGAKYLKKHGMVDDLDESDEINACSIEVPVTIDGKTEQWLVQFKNETRRRSSRSAARQHALAARSATRFPAERMSIRRCALPAAATRLFRLRIR